MAASSSRPFIPFPPINDYNQYQDLRQTLLVKRRLREQETNRRFEQDQNQNHEPDLRQTLLKKRKRRDLTQTQENTTQEKRNIEEREYLNIEEREYLSGRNIEEQEDESFPRSILDTTTKRKLDYNSTSRHVKRKVQYNQDGSISIVGKQIFLDNQEEERHDKNTPRKVFSSPIFSSEKPYSESEQVYKVVQDGNKMKKKKNKKNKKNKPKSLFLIEPDHPGIETIERHVPKSEEEYVHLILDLRDSFSEKKSYKGMLITPCDRSLMLHLVLKTTDSKATLKFQKENTYLLAVKKPNEKNELVWYEFSPDHDDDVEHLIPDSTFFPFKKSYPSMQKYARRSLDNLEFSFSSLSDAVDTICKCKDHKQPKFAESVMKVVVAFPEGSRFDVVAMQIVLSYSEKVFFGSRSAALVHLWGRFTRLFIFTHACEREVLRFLHEFDHILQEKVDFVKEEFGLLKSLPLFTIDLEEVRMFLETFKKDLGEKGTDLFQFFA